MKLSLVKISGMLIALLLGSCSLHFREGQNLEEKRRWEEASIEYRLAYVEDPFDGDVVSSLERVNKEVARENLDRYNAYLKEKEFRKAFRRLEAAALQDPSILSIPEEQNHWQKVLIAGKIDFQFDRISANIRLADQMQLQIQINSPSGKILTADISNENGIFFVEDLLYKKSLQELPLYSIHAIGLRLVTQASVQRSKKDFRRFIYFRSLAPNQITGQLQANVEALPQSVMEDRALLLQAKGTSGEPWFPPALVRYTLNFQGNTIRVKSAGDHKDFLPDVLYVNQNQKRAFVDFGVYQLNLNQQARRWSIQKVPYLVKEDDYFTEFSKNLALFPYFFYSDGVYRYLSAK